MYKLNTYCALIIFAVILQIFPSTALAACGPPSYRCKFQLMSLLPDPSKKQNYIPGGALGEPSYQSLNTTDPEEAKKQCAALRDTMLLGLAISGIPVCANQQGSPPCVGILVTTEAPKVVIVPNGNDGNKKGGPNCPSENVDWYTIDSQL